MFFLHPKQLIPNFLCAAGINDTSTSNRGEGAGAQGENSLPFHSICGYVFRMEAANDLSPDVAARRAALVFSAALRRRCRAFLAAFFDTF